VGNVTMGMKSCIAHFLSLSTPTYVGNVTRKQGSLSVLKFSFNPHVCGECYIKNLMESLIYRAFNPHVCGECYEHEACIVMSCILSTPTYVGNVTNNFTCRNYGPNFQPPRMWGMLRASWPSIFTTSRFQPPRMWGMLRS